MTSPPQKRTDGRKRPRLSATQLHERRAKALLLRNAGATWDQIGEQIGIHPDQAAKDVNRQIRETVRVPAEQMVDRQRAILLDFVRVEFQTAVDKTVEQGKRHAAQNQIMAALRDERQMFGLNAPTKLTLGISEEEFARQAAELLKVTGTKPLLELANTIDAEVIDAGAVCDPADPAGVGRDDSDDEPWSNI